MARSADKVNTVVITDSENPSVEAAIISNGYKAPIVYVGEEIPEVTKEFLKEYKRTSDVYRKPMKVVFVGIGEEVQEEIEGLMRLG